MTTKELAILFPSLEKEVLEEMDSVGEVRSVAEGEVLMRSGQNIRSAILVLSGLVKIYRQDDEGGEFFMYYLDAGKACAISLVCALGTETSGLVGKALTASTILTIPVASVNEWMGKYKSWAQFAVSSYRERFDELLQTIDGIAFRNMDERLVFYLKRHKEKTGSNRITTSFTQIAQDLNSSREVISRLMKKLSDRNMITLYKTHVEILNLDTSVA